MPLSEHINLWPTCLQVLEAKGYHLSVLLDSGGGVDEWLAERDGFQFRAGTPLGLLGLVAIRDAVAPGTESRGWWRATTDPNKNVEDRLVEAARAREEALVAMADDPVWGAKARSAWETNERDMEGTAAALDLPRHVMVRVAHALHLR